MRTKLFLAISAGAVMLAASSVLASSFGSQAGPQVRKFTPPPPVVKKADVRPADSIEFTEIMKGVSQAALWGNPKAFHASLTKFKAGTAFGMHTHTANVTMVVISGTIVTGDEAGVETKLGPGSYLSIPGGVKHTTACEAGKDCVFYEELSREFDLKPVEAPKAP